MDLYLDDEPLGSGAATVAEAVRAGAAAAALRGRVVVEVYCDGQALPDSALDADSDAAQEGGKEVRLVSVEPRSFVRVTLLDAADALDQLAQDQRRAAELVERGERARAFTHIESAITVWEAVRRALADGAALLAIDLDSVALHAGARVTDRVGALSRALEELRRCIKGDDVASLCDTLRFELDAEAAAWRDMLRTVASRVADTT